MLLRRLDDVPNTLQRIDVAAVLLPESFRGGCSFGAVLLGIVSPAVTHELEPVSSKSDTRIALLPAHARHVNCFDARNAIHRQAFAAEAGKLGGLRLLRRHLGLLGEFGHASTRDEQGPVGPGNRGFPVRDKDACTR